MSIYTQDTVYQVIITEISVKIYSEYLWQEWLMNGQRWAIEETYDFWWKCMFMKLVD